MKSKSELEKEAQALTFPKQEIEIDSQIIFDRPNCLIVCRIIEITEKAVKVDYANEPISFGSKYKTVYSYSCYIPKSVIINDKHGCLTVARWFAKKFTGGVRIKRYFLENGVKIFV